MKPWVNTPPGSRAEKTVHVVYWVLWGVSAALIYVGLARQAPAACAWILGFGLAAAALAAFAAPCGARRSRFGVWCGGVFVINAAVVTGTAVAAVERGEHKAGLLILGVLWLVLALLPLVAPRQRRPVVPTEAVRRLGGLDYVLRAVEVPDRPMNVMMVWPAVGPTPTADSAPLPLGLDHLRRQVADRIGVLPVFRSRVVAVPFGLSHPVYLPDPKFDIANHVEEHFLPTPGTEEALDAYCAAQAGRPLDRRRPLWRLTLVHGLSDGRQAVVLTVHHCVSDGFVLLKTVRSLFGEFGSDVTSVPESGQAPGAGRLVADALAHQARTARRLPALIGAGRAAAAAKKKATASGSVRPPQPRDAPYCLLNEAFTGRRTFARTSLAVCDLERVRDAAGVTTNDVMLALVAEALRAYLVARECLPARPLVAAVPVGLDRPNSPPRTFGNRVGFLTTTLATDIVDPWERLLKIGSVTARAKRLLVVSRPELVGEWLDQVPPLMLNPILRHQVRRENRPGTASSNVIVTHVREVHPIDSLAGAPVEAGYGVGPSNGGSAGPMVGFTSYPDRLLATILSAEAAIGEPREFIAGLHRALADLLSIAAFQAATAAAADGDGAARAVPSVSAKA